MALATYRTSSCPAPPYKLTISIDADATSEYKVGVVWWERGM
jgi:hypothetical protein